MRAERGRGRGKKKKKRMRGVVAQWYHRVDKSATATRDPAPSPAGCGSDFPKLSAQRPAVSVHCPLILQQALGKPLLIYLQGTFRHRGIKREEGEDERQRERMKMIERERAESKKMRGKTQTGEQDVSKYPLFSLYECCLLLSPWKPVLFPHSL